jgi:hypothetical protein
MENTATDDKDWDKQWGRLVAKAWADDELKARLLQNPEAVLKEHSIAIPPGTQVKVVENTEQLLYLPLPARPSQEELANEDLLQVAGGIRGNDSCSLTYFPRSGQNGPPSKL